MSIKTNELQQAAVLKGADTLLLADSAAGTARVSLTNLAKFLTEGDNAVKTALSNKAALSAQETVEVTYCTQRKVEVAASELHDYIARLPRLLTESLGIAITAGTSSGIELSYFYGPGSLSLYAKDGAAVTIPSVYASHNHTPVYFNGIQFANGSSEIVNLLQAGDCHFLNLENCSFRGAGSSRIHRGFTIGGGSAAYLGSCTFQNLDRAVTPSSGTVSHFYNCSGSDNACGFFLNGGIVLLGGTTPETLGGTTNGRYSGGLIVKANGTLL